MPKHQPPGSIRVTLTFDFDKSKISADTIKNRLDDLLCREFNDVDDWNARWVARPEDAPILGTGARWRRESKTTARRT